MGLTTKRGRIDPTSCTMTFEEGTELERLLLDACEGRRSAAAHNIYWRLRSKLIRDQILSALAPKFIRTCRDLDHFWIYIKSVSPHWEPRRVLVRSEMTPLLDHLEVGNKAPIDIVASAVLQSFDVDGVHAVWQKALLRRHSDPDGAITSARTLLESVCKRILDEAFEVYSEKDDLPALYRAVSQLLTIAPSQHTEEAFKRILGGATSVVEGLGSLRNKIGDAHGQGGRPVRPTARHAQLAVNLAGTMATFLVETWSARSS
jgi:hypothetical protein